MQIHIVDDQKTMLAVVAHIITSSGITRNVVQHSDAMSLLRVIHRVPCHIVISDWNMPNTSGLDLLRMIRNSSDEIVRSTPVILLTGEAKANNVIEAQKAGVTDYIVKPVPPAVLLDKIRKIAARRGYALPALSEAN